jgi:tRNA1(Val) A37 N6-methylase TrmN6
MPFTYKYQQPDEYHFSLDSIQLAQFVASQFETHPDLGSIRVLDLCAGCGVIGLELAWHLRTIRHIEFIEIQDIYTHYFYQNLAMVNRPELECRWHLMNYDELLEKKWEGTFDLILSNPPYFQPGHGVLSSSTFKNRCRFYLDSSFAQYIRALEHSLAPNGAAYFLLRPLNHHGFDLFSDIQKILADKAVTVKKIARIRGTDIVLAKKLGLSRES